jgi:mannose-6-phosphate isomerase-like protein (cupin superfamily)
MVGARIFLRRVDRSAGTRLERFLHDTDEIVMLLEGEQEFEFGGKNCRLKRGEEMLIPAGTRHAARNVGGVTSKWLYGYKGK